MSIIFGLRKNEGETVSERELCQLASATERYAPDGMFICANGRIGMGCQPYRTHDRLKLESQPTVDGYGNVLSFDGRLDNYKELGDALDIHDHDIADSSLVLIAFERWGEGCFSRLIGDWSLALWVQRDCSLYLARDHAGTRTLYFENIDGVVRWSTYLETFFVDGQTRHLDLSYAACYLASQPIRDLTPYRGITAVTPAHYFVFYEDRVVRKAHWRWMVNEKLHYRTDTDYEEHFFDLFRQSVERRTGPGAPILAELSGGMDSTSIVCMSDYIRQSRRAKSCDLVDTISYYDDSEPNWNERPYFSIVELKRGKVGIHVQSSFVERTFSASDPSFRETLWPGADSATIEQERRFHQVSSKKDYRTVVSGIGGDELLGGVPTPLPELADYLATGRFIILLRRAMEWCLLNRNLLMFHHAALDRGGRFYCSYDFRFCVLHVGLPRCCDFHSRQVRFAWPVRIL